MFYLIFKKKINDKPLQVIFLLLVIGVFADAYSSLRLINGRANFAIFNFFLLVETVFLLTFFYQILKSKFSKWLVISFSAVFILTWIYFFVFKGNSDYYDICVSIENTSIIVLTIVYFYEQISLNFSPGLYTVPRFWVVSAYFLNAAGTFFLFLYLNKLQRSEQENYYLLNYASGFIKSILLTIAMFMRNKPPERKKFQLT